MDFNHVDPKLLASGSDDAKGMSKFNRKSYARFNLEQAKLRVQLTHNKLRSNQEIKLTEGSELKVGLGVCLVGFI